MKTSKRVLGVVLTLIMLVNVFAVSVFAAYPDDAAVALIIKTDKANYAKGDDVVLTLAIKATEEVGPVLLAGQFELGFNSAGIAPYSDSSELSDHGFEADAFFKDSYDKSMSQVLLGDDTASTIAAGKPWDSLITFCVADDGETAKACATEELVLFTVKMKVPENATDGTYTIGYNRDGFESNYTAYASDLANGDLSGSDGSKYGKTYMFDFGEATFTVGQGGPTGPTEPTEPTATLANLDPRVQWKESGSNVICIGFEGQITGEAIVVDDVVNSKIAEIGFEFSTTDNSLNGATKVKVDKIYDFTGNTPNTYKFRAVVVKAMSAADATDPDEGGYTHNLYARAYVTIGDKTTYATDIIETTVYDEYSEGVASGLATLAANLG